MSERSEHDCSRHRWVRLHRRPRRSRSPSGRPAGRRCGRPQLRQAHPHRRFPTVRHGRLRRRCRRAPGRDHEGRGSGRRHPLRRPQAGRRIGGEAAVVLPAEHQRHAQRADRHARFRRQEACLLLLRRHLRRAAGGRGARGRGADAADQPVRPDQAVRRVDGPRLRNRLRHPLLRSALLQRGRLRPGGA